MREHKAFGKRSEGQKPLPNDEALKDIFGM